MRRRLRVLTYNVCACPQAFGGVLADVASDPWRFTEGHVPERLAGYDVVGLCEMFASETRRIHDFVSFATRISGPGPRGSGQPYPSGIELFATLPRSTTHRVQRHHFSERGLGWDGFAAKGVLLAWLAVPGGRLLACVTHLQSGVRPEEVRLRSRQLRELHAVVSANARDDAVLVMGDFNVDGNDSNDPGNDLLHLLFADFSDAAAKANPRPEPTWDPGHNSRATGAPARLDLILYRSGRDLDLELVEAGVALTERVRGVSLSDHFGVEAAFDLISR